MDTKLNGGDFARNAQGLPFAICGEEELIQRIIIRLSVRRGSVPMAPGLGSRLHQLSAGSPDVNHAAFACVQEALAGMDGVVVREAQCLFSPQHGRLTVKIRLELSGRTKNLEVTI